MFIQGSSNTVGGTTAASSNTIAFNGVDGVAISFEGGTGNRVLSNSIFSNGGIEIDLGDGRRFDNPFEGPTANDPGDADSGANCLLRQDRGQHYHHRRNAREHPNTTFRVQFFSKPFSADLDVEGMNLVGEKFVSTDATRRVTFTFQPSSAVAVGDAVTATATTGGNTSEFSAPKTVENSPISIPPTPLPEGS